MTHLRDKLLFICVWDSFLSFITFCYLCWQVTSFLEYLLVLFLLERHIFLQMSVFLARENNKLIMMKVFYVILIAFLSFLFSFNFHLLWCALLSDTLWLAFSKMERIFMNYKWPKKLYFWTYMKFIMNELPSNFMLYLTTYFSIFISFLF